jgi:chromosome segregation ATPase
MSESEVQLKRIHEKLQQLLKQHTALQKENIQLKEQLDTVREQASLQLKNMEELKQQVSILKMGTGEMSETDKKEFEKKINSYVKEIDRCIAMLGE